MWHFWLLHFQPVKKNGTDASTFWSGWQQFCGFEDTVKIAITDLGTGTYFGIPGGLYPGGANDPSGQYKKDLKKFAKDIMPLNGSGAIDSVVERLPLFL